MLGGVPSRNEIPHVRVESDPQVYPRGNIAARWYISKVRGRRPLKGSLLSCYRGNGSLKPQKEKKSALIERTLPSPHDVALLCS